MVGKNFIYSFILATSQKSVIFLGHVLAVIVTVMSSDKGKSGAGPCNVALWKPFRTTENG